MALETTSEKRIYLEDIRCGKLRPSMKSNLLIQYVELGKVCNGMSSLTLRKPKNNKPEPEYSQWSPTMMQPKKTTFQSPPPERIFGIVRPADPEGARDGKTLFAC